jgi:hypothetical protein
MEMISARYLQPQSDMAPNGSMPWPREQIAAHYIDRARGVDERTAHARMTDFYRSSGHAWALALKPSPVTHGVDADDRARQASR